MTTTEIQLLIQEGYSAGDASSIIALRYPDARAAKKAAEQAAKVMAYLVGELRGHKADLAHAEKFAMISPDHAGNLYAISEHRRHIALIEARITASASA